MKKRIEHPADAPTDRNIDLHPQNRSYWARYTREGVTFTESFAISKYDSYQAAFEAAKQWADDARRILPPMSRKEFRQIKRKNNTSGYPGVERKVESKDGIDYPYWEAVWVDNEGKRRHRSFYIKQRGEEEAQRLAIEARENAIAELDEWDDSHWQPYARRENEFPSDADDVPEFIDPFGYEGDEKYKIHRDRERDPRMRAVKLAAFLNEHGALFCELCHFSFELEYGRIGQGLIEVHHLVPLAEMTQQHKTTLDQLMCVCANCHMALHNGDPTANLDALRFIYKSRKSKRKSAPKTS